tara:strand:- start:163 stop:924 length:762 start_codon:yes stop_codon:yes gene_type:complete
MKITRAQIRKFLSEEVEAMTYKIPSGKTDEIISHDHPSEAQLHQDAWAGGQNLHKQEEHQLQMGSKEKTVRGVEHYKIAENYLSRKALRNFIENIVSEATIDHRVQEADDDAINLLSHILVAGCETIFGEDLSEEDEYEYGMDFASVLTRHPEVTAKLSDIAMEIRMGAHDGSRMNDAPPMSRDEVMNIVIDMFRRSSPGELSESEFNQVMEEIVDEYDFVSAADLAEMNITYDEVLRIVGQIENEGMPTDRP